MNLRIHEALFSDLPFLEIFDAINMNLETRNATFFYFAGVSHVFEDSLV